MSRHQPCPDCEGFGEILVESGSIGDEAPHETWEECPICDGVGEVEQYSAVLLLLVVATVAAALWWLTDPATPAMARVWVYMVAGVALILTLHRNPREVVTRWL